MKKLMIALAILAAMLLIGPGIAEMRAETEGQMSLGVDYSTINQRPLCTDCTSELLSGVRVATVGKCHCLGARRSTYTCTCVRPNGSRYDVTGVCWEKKVLGSSPVRYCSKTCESCFMICRGERNRQCREF